MVNRAIHVIFSCKGWNTLRVCCGEQLTDKDHIEQEKPSFGKSDVRPFHRKLGREGVKQICDEATR